MRAVSVIAKYAGIFHPGSSDGTILIDDLSEANISKNHLFSESRHHRCYEEGRVVKS